MKYLLFSAENNEVKDFLGTTSELAQLEEPSDDDKLNLSMWSVLEQKSVQFPDNMLLGKRHQCTVWQSYNSKGRAGIQQIWYPIPGT